MSFSAASSAKGFQYNMSINDAKSGELLGTIDDKIAYIAVGSTLSPRKSVLRIESPGLVQELTKGKKDKSKRETYISQKQSNLRYSEQPIRLALSMLPPISPCKKCGGNMVAHVRRTDDHGQPFYGCENFRRTGCKNKEEVTEIHLIHISELSYKPCSGCGKPTKIVNAQFDDLRFECAAPTPCGFAQRIEFYKA